MDERVQGLLNEYTAGLSALYGPRLCGVYLFGSYARGNPDAESDVDVLIVLDKIDHHMGEIERTSMLTSDLSLQAGLTLSRVFVSREDWLHGSTPFLLNVREYAIAI